MSETPNRQQSSLLEEKQDQGNAPAPSRAPKLATWPQTGLLATNHLNLMYMLGAGLLMPPSGFGGKYYRDTLAAYAGWLPLFVGHGRKAPRAPRAAIEESTSEARHLRPVLVEIELAGLRGPVHVHGGNGAWDARLFEVGKAGDEWLLCVPAPLPTTRIRTILFASVDDRRNTETDAAERGNVPLLDFTRRTTRTSFSGSKQPWPPGPEAGGPEAREASLARAQAAGGVMGILQALANSGELAVAACRAAYDPNSGAPDHPILKSLPVWIRTGAADSVGARPDSPGNLFWGTVDRLVERRRQLSGGEPKPPRIEDETVSDEDALLGFLRDSGRGMESGLQERAKDLMETLESLGSGLGGSTISRMLHRHERPLARAMILFFLRRRSKELVNLVKDYRELSEGDRLAAAVLFGVRDGWLGLPRQMRGAAEVGSAVAHRMAALAQRVDKSDFELGEAPVRARSLRELFQATRPGSVRERNAAVALARELKWPCIRSRVRLRAGEYRLKIERGTAQIDFDGEPPVETWVERSELLDRLAGEPVEPKIEAKVRKILGR